MVMKSSPGERRYKACILAGYSEVPCNVMSADEQKLAELALVENIQRENLTSIEEAKAYIQISARWDDAGRTGGQNGKIPVHDREQGPVIESAG